MMRMWRTSSAVALILLAGCATASAQVATGSAPADGLKLERVVMLMRHGVRPPTKAQVTPEGTTDKPWPAWSAGYGELTQHGYDAVKLVGAWDRTAWVARGLLPASGCPAETDVMVAASSKSRTQATARALVEGLAPGCKIDVDFPATEAQDVEFHPLDAGAVPIDADEAMRAVTATLPPGGMPAEVTANAARFTLLNTALGCCTVSFCAAEDAAPGCDISKMPSGLVRVENDRPDVGDPFGLASTASQTFLLEYLEGMPMADVAWGRLTRPQIEDLLEFHSLKFKYEGRSPYVAARAASPLARRMLEAMLTGPKLTVLVGHDTNIADIGGFLDLHWQVPSYPRDDPPPGGAVGFEVLSNASGARFVHAFYRSQTMDQVRELRPLTGAEQASYTYLAIPGCAEICPIADFERIVRGRLIASVTPAP